MFFKKQEDLVDSIKEWRKKYNQQAKDAKREMDIRDMVANNLQREISALKEEVLTAKRILKDSNLCMMANRRYTELVAQDNANKFMTDGGVLTEIIDQQEEVLDTFELELPMDQKKLLQGTDIKLNSQVPKEALTIKNQYHKLNFSQTTKNSIKIRRKTQTEQSKEAVSDASKVASLAASELVTKRREAAQRVANDIGASTLLQDGQIGPEPADDLPSNVMDWFNRQTRPGTNLRKSGEAFDEDLLGGGEFGKIYLKSLKRQ